MLCFHVGRQGGKVIHLTEHISALLCKLGFSDSSQPSRPMGVVAWYEYGQLCVCFGHNEADVAQ